MTSGEAVDITKLVNDIAWTHRKELDLVNNSYIQNMERCIV